MTNMKDEFAETTKKARDRRFRKRIVLLATVVLVVAGGVWGTTQALRVCGSFGSGVYKIDGECVGVTDGSYVFRSEFAGIEKRIADENDRVRAQGTSYVTIALLDPLSASSGNVLPSGEIKNRLEGAYTALRRANTTPVVGDTSPQIQLVLASEGRTDAQWQRVTDQLVEMSRQPKNPLVAVIGMGVSTKQTQQRAEKLSAAGIPMVSAYLGADVLDYTHIPGLIKAAPSNRYYVDALRRYVDSNGITSAILVEDSNSEQGVDLFTQELKNNFIDKMGDLMRNFTTQVFTGVVGAPSGADPHLFSNIVANICSAGDGLQAVLYAGREVDLRGFLHSLEFRPCLGTRLTILTAGLDLSEILNPAEEADLRDKNLKVVVASTVDAEGWRKHVTGTPEHYQELFSAFTHDGFDAGDLNGANAIMMHDALLTAIQAVRLAAPKGSISTPTAATVKTLLLNLNGQYAVPGGSGTLSFSDHAGDTGEPVGKPLPVLQYPPPSTGPSRQVGPLYCVMDQLKPSSRCTG